MGKLMPARWAVDDAFGHYVAEMEFGEEQGEFRPLCALVYIIVQIKISFQPQLLSSEPTLQIQQSTNA